MKDFAKALNMGGTVVLCLLIPFGIGYYIDGQLHTKPIGIVIGLLFGVVMAFYSLYRLTK